MWEIRLAFYGINLKFLRIWTPDFHVYREQKKINMQNATLICCLMLYFFSLTLCKTKQSTLASQEFYNDVDILLLSNNDDPSRKLPAGYNSCRMMIN